MTASSDTSFLFTAITCDEGRGADEEEHDEREGCTVVPHRIVDVLLNGGTEELDVVHRQQFGDSEGRDGWHEYHQDATCYARHGEGQDDLEELLPRRCSQVFGCFDIAAVHLLQGVVDGVNHEWDEVVDHTEQEGALTQRKVGKIEEGHGGKCAHQDVYPHRQNEEHDDGVGILHPGLCQNIGGRIAQQNAEQGVENGDAYRIHKGVDGFGVCQELLEVVERQGSVLIGKCEHYDEKQWQYHKYRCKDGVRYRPALSRRDKLDNVQFIIDN